MNNQIFYTIDKLLCGISAFTCFLVLLPYAFAKPLRISAFRIIFWLNLSNFFKFLALSLPFTSSLMCKISGYIYFSGSLTSILWTCLIARRVYESIILNQQDSDTHHYCAAANFIIIPLCICSIPFVFDAYGLNAGACVLKETKIGILFNMFIYFFPGFVAIIYCSVVYKKVYWVLRMDCVERDVLRLRFYPLILIFCFIPTLVIRILQYFGIFSAYIYLCGTFVNRLQGFFDALAYVVTPPVVRYLKMVWSSKPRYRINDSDLFSMLGN